MTAAVVGTVSVLHVTSRNSAIAAVPAKNFLTKKTPVDVTKAHIAINSTTGDADSNFVGISCYLFIYFSFLWKYHGNFRTFTFFTEHLKRTTKKSNPMLHD